MPKYKVLVAGASGLVSFAAMQHFASVDLQDRQRCVRVFGRMHNVTHLLDFAGGSFELTDLTFAYGAESPPPPILVSTVKIRQAGFHDCLDTEDMFHNLIGRYQELGWIPPV